MTDIIGRDERSRLMGRIRGKNTKPEMSMRRGLHRLGFRFRLHDRRLAGTPDIVLRKWNAAIFVNGCFWHGHDCHLYRLPKTRSDFWLEKIGRNRERDRITLDALLNNGWRVLLVWECALKGRQKLEEDRVLTAMSHWILSSDRFDEIRGA